MNQILSVEMPNKSSKRKNRSQNKKASTKSVVIFFSIVLLIFGIILVGVGIYSNTRKNNNVIEQENTKNNPRIDVTQNAGELDIEVLGQSEISKVEYRWSNGETEEVKGNGTNLLEISIKIPSGTNTFEIIATDIYGESTEHSQSFVGPKQPNVQLVGQEGNKIQVICQEEQIIKSISYYYDEEEEQKQDINSNSAQIYIDAKEGEHTLTIKVEYEDGTTGAISNKLYVPVVNVTTDRMNFIIKASDARKITNITINFNGEEEQINDLNNETFEKTLQLQDGENRLILTVYNTEGIKIEKRIRWEKK